MSRVVMSTHCHSAMTRTTLSLAAVASGLFSGVLSASPYQRCGGFSVDPKVQLRGTMLQALLSLCTQTYQ